MKPYYQDDLVTLYHGDALDVMQTLAPESVDIVVTSPPYNMGLTPGGNGRGLYKHTGQKASRFTNEGYSEPGDDAMDPEEYAALRTSELWEMHRIVRSSVWWNHRPRILHGVLVDPIDALRCFGHEVPAVRQRITLARPTGIDVNLNHFVTRGEHLYLFAKAGFSLVSRSVSGMGDVWPTPIVDSDHPAPFHESIPERCIEAVGATSVLDPFAGSGTTLAVAKRRGIKAIGIERSERFCEMAANRCGAFIPERGSLFDSEAAS